MAGLMDGINKAVSKLQDIGTKAAEGAKELGLMMAPDMPVEAAGGLPDGSLGTDYETIRAAIEKVSVPGIEAVLIIMDSGSACMTAEMVLEERGDSFPPAVMVDCAFVEGTMAACVSASCGDDVELVKKAAEEAGKAEKF